MDVKDDNIFEWKCSIKAAVCLHFWDLLPLDPNSNSSSQIHLTRMEPSILICPYPRIIPSRRRPWVITRLTELVVLFTNSSHARWHSRQRFITPESTRKVLYASLSWEMKYVFHFVCTTPLQIRISGSLQSVYLLASKPIYLSYDMRLPASKVLSIIQEKVNNPSPDDPFEPDIAAVNLYMSCLSILVLIDLPSCSKPTRPSFWQLQRSGQRSKNYFGVAMSCCLFLWIRYATWIL